MEIVNALYPTCYSTHSHHLTIKSTVQLCEAAGNLYIHCESLQEQEMPVRYAFCCLATTHGHTGSLCKAQALSGLLA